MLFSCQDVELLKKIEIAKNLVLDDALNFDKLSPELKNNEEVILTAIRKSWRVFNGLDIVLKEDENFVKKALVANDYVWGALSDRLQKNHEIRNIAVNEYEKRQKYEKLEAEKFLKKWNETAFVLIKGGKFKIGNKSFKHSWQYDYDENKERINPIPEVDIILEDFLITKSEITVEAYRHCFNLGFCKSSYVTSCNFESSDSHYSIPVDSKNEQLPVNCINWEDLMGFAKWVGGDLPSEAQWEYAARAGGQNIRYPWGDAKPTCNLANYEGCESGTTHVCSKTDGNTQQGLCDMIGNVAEVVLDDYHDNYKDIPRNGIAFCEDTSNCKNKKQDKFIVRGDSHETNMYMDWWESLTVFNRYFITKGSMEANPNIGFRIVKK